MGGCCVVSNRRSARRTADENGISSGVAANRREVGLNLHVGSKCTCPRRKRQPATVRSKSKQSAPVARAMLDLSAAHYGGDHAGLANSARLLSALCIAGLDPHPRSPRRTVSATVK